LKEHIIYTGIDIGSVYAKMVVRLPDMSSFEVVKFIGSARRSGQFLFFEPVKVKGQPLLAVAELLRQLIDGTPASTEIMLQLTGSQAKRAAQLLAVPCMNEFKAIARGCIELVPKARTILEIGGDGSRFIQVQWNPEIRELNIVDYNRNGECAAGTGSFIDQQAARMNYDVSEIGPLVQVTDSCANIAGRCSVFAKSDMVHAQQRGYLPGAIFKGLCEAVVRNYKGTVIRGKNLLPTVVLVGGVAANQGVVDAVRQIFELTPDELIVPEYFQHIAALGCAVMEGGAPVNGESVERLRTTDLQAPDSADSWPRLDARRVRFENSGSRSGQHVALAQPIKAFLGLDIGSVSTNLALIDEQGHVLDEIYTRTEGRPIQVVQREMAFWQKKWEENVEILGVGATGSGRELIGELVGADVVHDEITAHKTGASTIAQRMFGESVDTIFEIGGQDSKFISIEDGVVIDFAMNEACAAGTGSFLEEQAGRLGISIKDDFAKLALASDRPIRLGERCTVFMEKDVAAFMQQGRDVRDICAGLAYAVVYNYLNRVVRGRKIGHHIYFQGGTAYNQAVAAAFASVLDREIVVPPHNGVLGAVGAALLAREKRSLSHYSTRFRGFDLSQVRFAKRQFICQACTNQCDIQEITINGERSYWGDKCSERYRKKRPTTQKPVIPDLVGLYHQWLHEDVPAADGLGVRIGFPKAMYFWDRFPFWRAYFAQIGAEVVLSDDTTTGLAAKGRELCVAEPCFPIVVGHGHFADLLEKDVDYIFLPQIINSETEMPQLESWACPWGQTLPLVIRNTRTGDANDDRLLMPILHFRDGAQFLKKELHRVAARLGVSKKRSDLAVDVAYQAQEHFRNRVQNAGQQALAQLHELDEQAVVIIGRPYNIYDAGVNLHVPQKLRNLYGMNVLPMDFLPLHGIDVGDIHENMFWNYGKRLLQACAFAAGAQNLHVIYFSNFKCGPDSYIKHFVRDAVGAPYLTLQFDDHSNDAGVLTRCEAFLESKGLLASKAAIKEKVSVGVPRHDVLQIS
jgi:predicted CoA-substrate-specific enzyme activase